MLKEKGFLLPLPVSNPGLKPLLEPFWLLFVAWSFNMKQEVVSLVSWDLLWSRKGSAGI